MVTSQVPVANFLKAKVDPEQPVSGATAAPTAAIDRYLRVSRRPRA